MIVVKFVYSRCQRDQQITYTGFVSREKQSSKDSFNPCICERARTGMTMNDNEVYPT